MNYISQKFDVSGHSDYSLSRCEGTDAFVLTPPSPGAENICTKQITLQMMMRSKDAVINYILQHTSNYNQRRRHVRLEGTCYATWDAYIFSFNQPEILATVRDQMISQAPVNQQKRGDPEDTCVTRKEKNKNVSLLPGCQHC